MKRDEGIQWIRDVRGVISKELHTEPEEYAEFHRSLRDRYRERSEQARLVSPALPRAARPSAPRK